MKKYICPNCGFISRFKTEKYDRNKRRCKNCGCKQVYSTKIVLKSMMRIEMLSSK